MKKIILGAAVLAAMMATSCQNEELVASQEQGNVIVKASTMNESRTFVQGRTIYWSQGDGLLAYGEDVLGSLTLVGQGGSTHGEFVGYVSGKKENLEYLVYPAEMASYKDGKVTIEIGTINKANSNAPMFAQWGSNVTFEQLTGMVRIQINDVPAKNNDLEVIGKGIGTAVFENGKITTYSTKDNTIKVTGLTAGSNEICIPVFTKNTTAQDVKLTFKLAGATKELTLPLAQKALTATNVPVLTYDATTKTLSEDKTLPGTGNEFEITNLTELYQFANLVKEGNTYEGKTVTLGANIDLDNMPWTPISGFKGTFDGAQFTISNLNVAVEGAASAGLFADGIGATIKNLKLQNVNVNGNWRTGAIIGDGSCVTIENCQVIGGIVTSTPDSNNDNGNHAGGIVGYLAADGGNASVTDCSVTGLTISAYRDVAGIAGTTTTDEKKPITPIVERNEVKNTVIIANQKPDYVDDDKASNAGEIVGRKEVEPTMSGNTVGEGVIVKAYVKEAKSMAQTLTNSAQNIEVILMNDIDLPISSLGTITGGSGEYKLGGEGTKKITIDLNKKKLNITTNYWSAIGAKNENATFTIRNGEMTSSQPTDTWNSYDLTLANCNYVIEGVVFNKAVALASSNKSITMTGVTINETHAYYALWIEAKGQNVVINGLTVNSGRGIKIDEQYVATPTKVTLNVSNADFNTNEKAAIMVKSAAGADITLGAIDISGVVADQINAVWVDEDSADSYDLVTVTGGNKKQE